jgi:NADPH:quinone reductase-like Zn-dependent oxidoreductase/acyl carrier protein
MDNTDDNSTVKADVYIYDEQGVIVAETRGYVMARTSAEGPGAAEKTRTTAANGPGVYYRTAWQRIPQQPQVTPRTGVTFIFADRQGYGIELYVQMQAQGMSCILLHRGETVNRLAAKQHYGFVTGDAEEFTQLFAQMRQDGVKFETVVNMIYCWGLDDNLPSGAGMDIAPSGITPLAALIGWLIQQPLHCPLTVITRKAQDVASNLLVKDHPVDTVAEGAEGIDGTEGAEENLAACAGDEGLAPKNLEDVEPLQSAYWGLVGVVHEEQPHLNLRCIDIDFDSHQTSHFSRLMPQLIGEGGERLLSLRGDKIYVPRLSAIDHVANHSRAINTSLTLKLADRGNLSRLSWCPQPRRALQPYEVEIAVKVTGLNLRDIFDALGLHPRRLDEFGLECSGVVSAVGDAVSRVALGDEVMAFGTGCLAQYCVVDENRVALKPAQFDWVQTATIPIAFLTAYYALIHCAKITAGDRVLIHAAAGGVGMAAVQLALQAGAHVYATASRGKWSALNDLGVKYVSHSRNLTFVDDINRWTDNGGVDIVLNGLADEFIGKSVSLLKEGGRFIEIGLQGWSVQAMQKQRVDVDYHIVNLMAKWESDPAAVRSMLDELLAMFELGSLTPLPCECFDSHKVISAFRHVQQGKHIGKVVVCQEPQHTDNVFAGTQIITGGLGAIGLKVAEHLVSQGCRQLALLSRRCVDAGSEKIITALRAQDANVQVYQVDIASPELDVALRDIRRNMGPIKGVFHTAGLTDDRPIQDLDAESFKQVLKPKVAGTYRLHRLTLTDDLNYFVLFSSMTSILGAVGVANYAAANAFMNSFAQYRNRFGLPAVSLAWGPWAGTGLFQRLSEQYRQRLQRSGLHVLDDRQNLSHFTSLFTQSGVIGVFSIDWRKWLQQGVSYKENPLFSGLKTAVKIAESQHSRASNLHTVNPAKRHSRQTDAGQKHSILKQLQNLSSRQRRSRLIDFLQVQLADVLALDDASSIDINAGFFDMGIDSLTSIEFRNRLQSGLSCSLPVTALYDYPSVAALADFILTHIQTATGKGETQQATDISSGAGERAMSAGEKNLVAENSTFADAMAISEEELVAELMR